MFALAKELPEVIVRKCHVRGDLEFQEMALGWVQVDGVDSGWALHRIRQDVISRTANCQNDIVRLEVQNSGVYTRIFPSESVDVLIVELLMLLELVVIVDSPVVILIEERGQRKIGREVENGSVESLGSDLGGGSLNSVSESIRDVGRQQVGGLGDKSIHVLNNLLRETGGREWLLVASQPDMVGNCSQHVVSGVEVQDGTEAILKVVPTTGLEANSVDIEPGTPEGASEEVDMAINETTRVVAEADISLGLNIEVDDSHNTIR